HDDGQTTLIDDTKKGPINGPCKDRSPLRMHSQKPRSLSDLGNPRENSAGRGQILSILKVNSRSIDQESGEI
ncbi:MAG: hypothetical protein ACSLFH_02610, partial [Desulfuromonadales bacterium]